MSVFDMRAEEIDDNYLKKLFTLLSYLLLFTAITGLVVSARDLLPSEQWNRTFGGAGYDAAYSVEQTPDGGYIVAGFTKSYGSGEEDMWIIKTDSNGFEQWNRTFGGTKNERAFSLQRTSDGS